MTQRRGSDANSGRPASLKTLADYLHLDPSTISVVLNDAPNRSIPEATRQRVRDAASKFGYEPSYIARSLRIQKTQTIGVMLPEMGDGYHSQVLNGMADVLMRERYFFFTAHHRHCRELVCTYPKLLHARGIEGLLTIDTRLEEAPTVPTVCVANHPGLPGVTKIILDEESAAMQSLRHLYDLGHRQIVFVRGQSFSADSDTRWQATLRAARSLNIAVRKKYTIRLEKDINTPELGYPAMTQLLQTTRDFTAVLCFNDVSAFGVIRSLADSGLRVPHDCSVVGFDDVPASAYENPRLTTVRQPLRTMGTMAAETLLRHIRGEDVQPVIRLDPELIIRESTSPARTSRTPTNGLSEA